jgi:hypothetical protein
MEVGDQKPVGNRLSARLRLRRGISTGAIKLVTPEGAALRVNHSHKGLGLVAATGLPAGAVVCRLHGVLVESESRPDTSTGEELFHVRAPAPGRLGRWLHLAPARTVLNLGNLINTGDRSSDNNCKLSYRSGNTYVTVKTLRDVAAGEELLASYGQAYARILHQAKRACIGQPARGSLEKVQCERCHRTLRVWQLKTHSGFACMGHNTR